MSNLNAIDRISKGWKAYVVLFFLTFLTAAPGIFTMPVIDRDEARFAQASKQMLETGDYILIREQDRLRNKKPAGIHWLQAGTTAIFSSAEAQQIWSYRIPSLVGAVLATCAAFWVGIPLIGRKAAFIGSALLGVGFMMIFETNMSKTDSVLLAITTFGLGALVYLKFWFYRPKLMSVLFWFAMAFGFLLKGPVTMMVAFFALVYYCLWQRRGFKWANLLVLGIFILFLDTYFYFGSADKIIGYVGKTIASAILGIVALRWVLDEKDEGWFRILLWWTGPVLFVLMVLPWFLWIQAATDGAFFQGAVGKDLKDKVVGASEGHGGLPGFHSLFVWIMFIPATLFLIPALTVSLKKIRHKLPIDNGVVFLVAWAIPTWALFEFLPTKLPHYTLPAYPALALLCGYAIVEMMKGANLFVSRVLSVLIFCLGAGVFALVASPIGVSLVQTEALTDFKTVSAELVAEQWAVDTSHIIYLAIFGACSAIAIFGLLARRFNASIVAAIISGIFLTLHYRVAFLPQETWLQSTPVARLALGEVCGLPQQTKCDQTPDLIQAYGYAEPSFYFTTGTSTRVTPQSSLVLPSVADAPVAAWVINFESQIVEENAVEILREQAKAQSRCFSKSSPHYAFNYAGGDPIHFVAVRIDEGPCGS